VNARDRADGRSRCFRGTAWSARRRRENSRPERPRLASAYANLVLALLHEGPMIFGRGDEDVRGHAMPEATPMPSYRLRGPAHEAPSDQGKDGSWSGMLIRTDEGLRVTPTCSVARSATDPTFVRQRSMLRQQALEHHPQARAGSVVTVRHLGGSAFALSADVGPSTVTSRASTSSRSRAHWSCLPGPDSVSIFSLADRTASRSCRADTASSW
jgi:hypothetical protein